MVRETCIGIEDLYNEDKFKKIKISHDPTDAMSDFLDK